MLLTTRKIMMVLAALIMSFSLAHRVQAQTEAEWTFFVYMAADNNLHSWGLGDLDEMKAVGSTQDVNIVVAFDGANSNDSRHYFIEQGNVVTVQNVGELNMGDMQTVKDSALWAFTQYPAQKNAIVFWNHGGGWRDEEDEPTIKHICSDDGSMDILDNEEIDESLAYIRNQIGHDKLSLIGFDACLMQMLEIAHYIDDDGRVMVGSEEVEGVEGWAYDLLLEDLVANPAMDAAELGEKIVQSFIVSDSTMSAVNLDHVDALSNAVDALADLLIAAGGTQNDQINQARNATLEFYDYDFIDLGDFADQIKQQGINDDIDEAADVVLSALESSVIHHGHNNYYGNYDREHGLSIYFPTYYYDSDYDDLQFALDTDWDDLVNDIDENPYNDECMEYSEYSCDPSDPCNWANDGICDEDICLALFGFTFDDGDDCSGLNCCDPSDPCDWANDGVCDEDYCLDVYGYTFDDSADCSGQNNCCDPSDPCDWANDGVCDEDYCLEEYGFTFDDSADCSSEDNCCDPSDPCDWANDGICDEEYCLEEYGFTFDDSADCGTPNVNDECADEQYTENTCDESDPCGWANDGICDEEYCRELYGFFFNDGNDCRTDNPDPPSNDDPFNSSEEENPPEFPTLEEETDEDDNDDFEDDDGILSGGCGL